MSNIEKDEKEVDPKELGIVVNKRVFLSAMRALGVLMEVTGDNFERVKMSNLDKHTKEAILDILANQLHGIATISNGFEASIVEGSLYNADASLN